MERQESDPIFQSALRVAKNFNSHAELMSEPILRILIVDTNGTYAFVTKIDSFYFDNLFSVLATFGFYNRDFAARVNAEANIFDSAISIPFVIVETDGSASSYLLEYDTPQQPQQEVRNTAEIIDKINKMFR